MDWVGPFGFKQQKTVCDKQAGCLYWFKKHWNWLECLWIDLNLSYFDHKCIDLGLLKIVLFCEFKEHVKSISIKQKKKLLGQNCPLQKSDDSFGRARQGLPAALWFFLAWDWDPCLHRGCGHSKSIILGHFQKYNDHCNHLEQMYQASTSWNLLSFSFFWVGGGGWVAHKIFV